MLAFLFVSRGSIFGCTGPNKFIRYQMIIYIYYDIIVMAIKFKFWFPQIFFPIMENELIELNS